MTEFSAKLQLPFIQPSQAQKHVTHNEALLKLDGLVQMSVASKDQTTPPGVPIDGESYIVPAGATGAWAGQDGALAIWQENVWTFYTPSEGWTAWVSDLNVLWSFDGSAWIETAPAETFQNIPMLGVNTTADTTNRLSVSSPSVLFNNEGTDIQVKLNKNAVADTASFLFQTGWSGRAEIGLTGDDDFHFKVSPDGATWFDGLVIDKDTGHLALLGVSGKIPVYDTGMSVFIGEGAGANDDLSDNQNVFVGYQAGVANTSGWQNVAIGESALYANTSGDQNTAVGRMALYANVTGQWNTALGRTALFNCTDSYNTGLGHAALRWNQDGTNFTNFTNCTGVGYNSRVSGSYQIQLGGSNTTTYAYGAVQDRSDARDKADIRDTTLGLDFISRLRPVDFRWDMRDDYFDMVEEVDSVTGDLVEKLVPIEKDGSRKRSRFHHGLIAQEVAEVLKQTGVDFGGFQDHARGGGSDVLSIGYTELIAPLIKAVQELKARVELLESKI